MSTIRYQRRPEVLRLAGVSNSTLHTQIRNKLFVPPVSLGARSVGWLEHEVNEVLAARAKGMREAEVRELVVDLIQSREHLVKPGAA